jgi:hypothetical protein
VAAGPRCGRRIRRGGGLRGIGLPDRTEDFTADPVVLFFDLACVFAFFIVLITLFFEHRRVEH